MSETIERNRQLLRLLCRVGQILGWVMIVESAFTIVGGSFLWKDMLRIGTANVIQTYVGAIESILTGLAAFVLVQLIRRLTEDDFEAKWVLRRGPTILYLLALCSLVNAVVSYAHFYHIGVAHDWSDDLTLVICALTNSFILIGIGLALRLALPIIDKSKTPA